MANPSTESVLAIVGTDHHPFDRLVDWVDRWAVSRGAGAFVQFGTSGAPTHAEGRELMPQDELAELLTRASAVVCHGGPGTIMAARDSGHLPIVVPRRPELGEHVDEHQVLFSARLAAEGQVRVAGTEHELHGLLDLALESPKTFRLDGAVDAVGRAADRFAEIVDAVAAPGSSGFPRAVAIVGPEAFSTSLGRRLGHEPGIAWIGDPDRVWDQGVVGNRPCGCGAAFHDCPMWSEVGKRAFGGWDEVDGRRIVRLQRALERPRGWTRVIAARLTPRLDAEVGTYAVHLARLGAAIHEVTGSRLIACSASLEAALLWRTVPGIGLRVVRIAGPADRSKGAGRLRLAALAGTPYHTVRVSTGSATVSEVLRFIGMPAGAAVAGSGAALDASEHALDA
jgi:UDP-N-acetylglucosamine transferase subunit ALG13